MLSKGIYKLDLKIDTKEFKDKEDLILGYSFTEEKKKLKSINISSTMDLWAAWKISNFQLLMLLNYLGNRSFSDITQYPVFPWTLTNFSKSELKLSSDLRDLGSPMGMLEIDQKCKERKQKYIDDFKETSIEMNEKRNRHYGSHYSNPLYISLYMTRIFPFSQIHIELQGSGFDDPDRLFLSLDNSFSCCTTNTCDVRELIPEFYSMPEIFLNLNNLDLGTTRFTRKRVSDVVIPIWAKENPFEFVAKHKQILESDEVSYKLNEWIDLIFGYKQRGKEAEQAGNVFEYNSYEDSVNLEFEDKASKEFLMRSVRFLN